MAAPQGMHRRTAILAAPLLRPPAAGGRPRAERRSRGFTWPGGRKGVTQVRVSTSQGYRNPQEDVEDRLQDASESHEIEGLPLPEGNFSLPFVGNTLDYFQDQQGFIVRQVQAYGPVSRASLFGKPAVVVAGTDLLNRIMAKEPGLLMQGLFPNAAALLGRCSLLNFDGEYHMLVRKLMAPMFSKKSVASYIPSIAKMAEEHCRSWSQKESMRFVDEMRIFSLGVVAEVALGIKFPLGDWSTQRVAEVFRTWVGGSHALFVNLPFTKFGKAMHARRMLIGMVNQAIESLKEDPVPRCGLREVLFARDENGNGLGREQLEDNILAVMFAGYDTTVSAGSTAILQLAKHPEAWQKIKEEQDNIISEYGFEFTEEAVGAMKYTEAVVKEALRVVPPVMGNFKTAAKTFEINGYRIPKGWTVLVATGSTAQCFDPRWPMDLEFRPERFLSGTKLDSSPEIVFGLGPHTCIGRLLSVTENKILLATLARNYDFQVANTDPGIGNGPIPQPEDGLPMVLTRRGDKPKH